MVNLIYKITSSLSFAFVILFSYNVIYQILPLFFKQKEMNEAKDEHKFAILIAARNEENVIGNLIDSLFKQNYELNNYDIYVIADNCTDGTAELARSHGAIVYERFNNHKLGKGYALDYLLTRIFDTKGKEHYDAFIVFDADNLVDANYLKEMNKIYSQGYEISTSYRNSKNYDENWISAAYSLNFIRESAFLNQSRMLLNTSSFVSGTGFMFSANVIHKIGGWKFFLLTEDIQFTTSSILDGYKIGYAKDAIFYDEQPTTLKASYHQRLRWSKGFVQVFQNYSLRLVKGLFSKKRTLGMFDILMTLLPVIMTGIIMPILTVSIIIRNISLGNSLFSIINHYSLQVSIGYLSLVLMALIVTLHEWKRIRGSSFKKIIYCFTYPLFMATYIPISIISIYTDVTWKPIKHVHSKSILEYKI